MQVENQFCKIIVDICFLLQVFKSYNMEGLTKISDKYYNPHLELDRGMSNVQTVTGLRENDGFVANFTLKVCLVIRKIIFLYTPRLCVKAKYLIAKIFQVYKLTKQDLTESRQIMQEIELLKTLNHENVVKMVEHNLYHREKSVSLTVNNVYCQRVGNQKVIMLFVYL